MIKGYETCERWALLIVVLAVLVVSGINPHDRFTWMLEVSWVVLGIPLLIFFQRRSSVTMLLTRLLALHAIVLIIGGYYTYELVPAGEWFSDLLGLKRNHYDRLGHLLQGFVPAVMIREIMLRQGVIKSRAWLIVLVTSVCLAFSAFFEMLEWWAALAWGQAANAFLGSQGDLWDAQWDMFMALIGALAALLLLGRLHDRAIKKLPVIESARGVSLSNPTQSSLE